MNIEDLTIRQIRELQSLIGGTPAAHSHEPHIGAEVIVRTRDAGVHLGVLQLRNGGDAVLLRSRRVYRWQLPKEVQCKGPNSCSELALYGLAGDSRVACEIPVHSLCGVIEVIPASADAVHSIREWKP